MSNIRKILVVDDESIGRELLEAILIPEGYKIFFGADGEEAVKLAVKELPDMILLDVMMPAKDGFEACREIRRNSTTAHIPVFLITALDDRDSRIKGFDAGADDYISKPFDRVEILAKIKNKSSQVEFIRKESSRIAAFKSENNTFIYDERVMEILINNILSENSSITNSNVFRSENIQDSQHVFLNLSTSEGPYSIFLSNNLPRRNAALINAVIAYFLFNLVRETNYQPPALLNHFHEYLSGLSSALTSLPVQSLKISLIIGQSLNNGSEISLAGHNQQIYYCKHAPNSIQTSYQFFSLTNNHGIKIKSPCSLFFLSEKITMELGPKKIVDFLDKHFCNPTQIEFKDTISHEFKDIPDILVVKQTV